MHSRWPAIKNRSLWDISRGRFCRSMGGREFKKKSEIGLGETFDPDPWVMEQLAENEFQHTKKMEKKKVVAWTCLETQRRRGRNQNYEVYYMQMKAALMVPKAVHSLSLGKLTAAVNAIHFTCFQRDRKSRDMGHFRYYTSFDGTGLNSYLPSEQINNLSVGQLIINWFSRCYCYTVSC